MGLFSKKTRRAIVPANTPYNEAWFRTEWQEITETAKVDPSDDRGQQELIWFTMVFLEETARQTFDQVEPGAWPAFQAGLDDDRSPTQMVSLLVGWNAEMLPVIEQRLSKFREMAIAGGQQHGHFRFGMDGLT